jgi:threonine aldolase
MMSVVDLRSDTVTKPTAGMREALARAEVGDDVLGDDPTVRALEERVAALAGKAAGLFVPSGTMGNQIAIRVHCASGDEIITHEGSHIIHYEGGGPAALSGCMVKGLAGLRGQFGAGDVIDAIRADNVHFARTRLVVIENTHNRGGGAVWKLDDVASVSVAARARGLVMHLDGARAWNACEAGGYTLRELAAHFDTLTVCMSKGLGAPVGSVVAGSREMMEKARRVRKLFGGGMRQAGVLAAACIYALDHHVARLREDHANAQRFAAIVKERCGGRVRLSAQHAMGVETNIVLLELDEMVRGDAAGLCDAMRERGVLMLPTGKRSVRAVTNLMVDAQGVERAASELCAVVESIA